MEVQGSSEVGLFERLACMHGEERLPHGLSEIRVMDKLMLIAYADCLLGPSKVL